MGRRGGRSGRSVNGIVLLDKPVGIGSNEALQIVKRLFHARKAGHTGSLDRLASGLLPICMGEATKLSGFLLEADKRYRASFRLGLKTSTGDAEGEVIESRAVPVITDSALDEVLGRFRGRISQIPPMHSAIKHHGQRLYKLAHKGIVVERQPRSVTIHVLDVLHRDPDQIHLEIACSKGTYIRTLAEDIGAALGCGASVSALHRIASGPFDAAGMHVLDDLRERAREGLDALDETLLPMQTALAGWPDVHLTDSVAYYLRQGQAVMVAHAPTRGLVKIYEKENRFLGVGEVLEDGRIAPRRLVKLCA